MNAAVQLTHWLAQYRPQAFAWGQANCCHFGAAWAAHYEGRNPMAGLASTPSAKAALRLLQQLGGSLQAAWTHQLGREPIAPAFAQVGDLLLFPSGDEQGTGGVVAICAGLNAVLPAPDGTALLFVARDTALAAWRLKGAS